MIVGRIPFGGNDLLGGIRNYIMIIIHVALIHIWTYIANKKDAAFKLINPGNFFKNSKEYKITYDDILHWEKAYAIRGCKIREIFIKIMYLAAWVAIGWLGFYCVDKLEYYSFSLVFVKIENTWVLTLSWLTLCEVFLLIGLVLNYFSFFSSLVFCYFIRELSNKYEKLEFRHRQPSSTTEFQILCYLSSRVSISFFMVSMLYILLLFSCIELGGPIDSEKTIYFCLLMLCVLLPCVVSLIVVFLLPKVFLCRLLRRWKRKAAKELDEKEEKAKNERDKYLIQKEREHVCNDRMRLMRTEIIIGAFALVVDFASLIICILQL